MTAPFRLDRFASLTLIALLAAGCGDDGHGSHEADAGYDCSEETRADTYMAGLTKVGDSGIQVVLVSSEPAPPARGDNVWTLQILNESDEPMDGLTVTMDSNVDIFMPDHGHGNPKQPTITDVGEDGLHILDPINLWMPGYWEVTPHISDGEGLEDQVTFKICIDD